MSKATSKSATLQTAAWVDMVEQLFLVVIDMVMTEVKWVAPLQGGGLGSSASRSGLFDHRCHSS